MKSKLFYEHDYSGTIGTIDISDKEVIKLLEEQNLFTLSAITKSDGRIIGINISRVGEMEPERHLKIVPDYEPGSHD